MQQKLITQQIGQPVFFETDNKQQDWLRQVNHSPIVPTIYGLPKLYKNEIPLHSILSTIFSSMNYLSKKLSKTIQPLNKNSPYIIKNSY